MKITADDALSGAGSGTTELESDDHELARMLADGAGPSNWHRFSHTPGLVKGASTGDEAADQGRVETLFVKADPWCWERSGALDGDQPQGRATHRHDRRKRMSSPRDAPRKCFPTRDDSNGQHAY